TSRTSSGRYATSTAIASSLRPTAQSLVRTRRCCLHPPGEQGWSLRSGSRGTLGRRSDPLPGGAGHDTGTGHERVDDRFLPMPIPDCPIAPPVRTTQTQAAIPPRPRALAPRATRDHVGERDRIADGEPDPVRSAARGYRLITIAAWIVASALPLIGLVSLFLRRELDPAWDSGRLHFVLFLAVGGGAVLLAYFVGQAADRRGDARVFLLSLAFLVTGGFLAGPACGPPWILPNNAGPGFQLAIPAGMAIGGLFACASAFVDIRPRAAPAVVRYRDALRRSAFAAITIWALFSLAQLPPLAGASTEGGGTFVRILAA